MKTFFTFVIAAVAAFALLVTSGCETEAVADAQISISPSSVTIGKGQSVTLTAQGGASYRWSLGEGGLGVLSGNSGEQVTFTATGTNGTQYINLSAFSGSTSNVNVSTTAIINVR